MHYIEPSAIMLEQDKQLGRLVGCRTKRRGCGENRQFAQRFSGPFGPNGLFYNVFSVCDPLIACCKKKK